MGLCKCIACPEQGNFEAGKYYSWLYSGGFSVETEHTVIKKSSDKKVVRDAGGKGILLPLQEYSGFFKDIRCADTAIRIYIDRKKELLLVPEFRREMSPFRTPLSEFERLSVPYTEDGIGQEFRKVWEAYKDHPVVRIKEAEAVTPFYKIVTKGKGWKAFASGRWMLEVEFVLSENEMRFLYWYKKQGTHFGINSDDRRIERILPMQASCEEIGHAVLSIFEEAGV